MAPTHVEDEADQDLLRRQFLYCISTDDKIIESYALLSKSFILLLGANEQEAEGWVT